VPRGDVRAAGGDRLTENDEREREIARLKTELERANADLDEVARVASHDLQEPIGVIQGYLRLFEERYRDELEPAAVELVDTALNSAQRAQSMIRDLLAWSRLRRRPLEIERFELAIACAQALGDLQREIDATRAEVRIGRLPAVTADRALVADLLRIVLDNALRFRGDAAPRIEIAAEEQGEQVVCTVADRGIGIDPRFAERVFGIFQRLHPRDRITGNGIGLALARTIVGRHGGRIWIEPASEGTGTRMRFALPRGGAPVAHSTGPTGAESSGPIGAVSTGERGATSTAAGASATGENRTQAEKKPAAEGSAAG